MSILTEKFGFELFIKLGRNDKIGWIVHGTIAMRLLLVQSGSYRLPYCLWIVWKFCWCISSGCFIIRAITDLCTNWIHMTTHLNIGHTNCVGTNTQGMEVPMDLPFSELQGPLVSFRKFSQFAGVFWWWWFQVLSQRYICIHTSYPPVGRVSATHFCPCVSDFIRNCKPMHTLTSILVDQFHKNV